jgi:hypothetical protein
MTVIQMHLHGQVPPMPQTVPYSVQTVVRRAMEKDAARRYQSAGEMMQHCQQVFAELNHGAVSVGGGGVPRTMIASGPQALQGMPATQPAMQSMQPPPMGPPQQQYGAPQQQYGAPQGPYGPGGPAMPQQMQGYAPAGAQAKTMIAQPSPFAGGQMPQQMPPQQQMPQPSGLAPQGFVSSSPAHKTIVAGMAPPMMGQYGAPQGTPNNSFPQQQQQIPPGLGPNKTVALQSSEGVVSVARVGGAVHPATGGSMVQGASTLFWIVSLAIGIAVGVLGYVIVAAAS